MEIVYYVSQVSVKVESVESQDNSLKISIKK